jgi:hypothetical protein
MLPTPAVNSRGFRLKAPPGAATVVVAEVIRRS